MIDKIIDALKELLNGDKPFSRKLRILRYVACIIILFIVFCNSYWNVLLYIDLPCAPLLEEKCRMLLHETVIEVFIVWIVYEMLFQNLYRVIDKKHHMELSYIDILVDGIFTLYFLLYAVNLGIEYANGLEIQIKYQAIIAGTYLIYGALSTSYTLHRIKYEHNQCIIYTGYCDSEGQLIPIDAKVFYRGKKYKIVNHEDIYRLLPYKERIISSRLIKLEDAASDVEGKLFIQK
jgi:hypothetical protein